MANHDEIDVQAIREARVHVIHDEPGMVVLQISGARDNVYFAMSVEMLSRLAARLTADARLLSAGPDVARDRG